MTQKPTTNEPMSDAAIARARADRGIPAEGAALRSWIRYQLSQHMNAATSRPYTQADIARETHVSEPTVSIIFSNSRVNGFKSGRVRRLAAKILDIPEVVLFGNVSVDTKAKEDST